MMKAKINTIFFVAAATIVNIILMSSLFLCVYSVYRILAGRHLSPGINHLAVFLLFAGSVVVTYFVHKKLLAFLLKKTAAGKYLRAGNNKGNSGDGVE
jgi:membrane protein implicated in regulation of membrane protease activity